MSSIHKGIKNAHSNMHFSNSERDDLKTVYHGNRAFVYVLTGANKNLYHSFAINILFLNYRKLI